MENVKQYLDQAMFIVLPYTAVVLFVGLILARAFRLPPFGLPRREAPMPRGPRAPGELLLFGYGILVLLAGHALVFLLPQQVLLWNDVPVRLYILEVSALIFSLMTLAGLVLVVVRRLTIAEARRATGVADWILYALLLLELVNGILVALFYPWASWWSAELVVPYLQSLAKFNPETGFVNPLPMAAKVHLVGGYLLLIVLPFTRLVRYLIIPEREKEERVIGNPMVTALFLVGLGISLAVLVPRLADAHMPGNDKGYEPTQPIPFSHRLHAGEMQISCLYCHTGAEKGPHAGIPATSICMNCHRTIIAGLDTVNAEFEQAKKENNRAPEPVISPKLKKLYVELGLNVKDKDKLLQPIPNESPRPIEWVRVHNLPAFTHFDHRAHVRSGVPCQICHGPVETMERVRQFGDLSMAWCLDCHRNASEKGLTSMPVAACNDCMNCHH